VFAGKQGPSLELVCPDLHQKPTTAVAAGYNLELIAAMPNRRCNTWKAPSFPDSADTFVAGSGPAFNSTDPATGDLVAVVATSASSDVDVAVDRATAAVRTTSWPTDGELRARVLYGFAQALRAQSERLAEFITREQGKTIHEARVEIDGSARLLEYYAGLARIVYGRAVVLGESVQSVILREPVGVVAIITPWNWPVLLLVRSLAPALAAGNAVVVKPASLTSAVTVETLRLLASEADMPGGVIMCVLGPGDIVGDALVGHDGVDMVAFTGETATGVDVMKRAAEGLRRVTLELGGKAPNIVFADASLDKAIEGAQNAAFTTCGQVCTAGSRLLVEDRCYDEVVERLTAQVKLMRVGDGLDDATDVGPLVSEAQQRKVLSYVERGRHEGSLVCGGSRPTGGQCDAGFFISPTIFCDLDPTSTLVRDEIFGPVLVIERFSDEEEALTLAGRTDFGLAAGVWTQNLDRAWRLGRTLQAGTVWVNTYHHFYAEAEVGGYKRSGVGRHQGLDGLYEFTEMKHLNFDSSPSLW
jgi:betaine-aldehyde dehydrogenase